LEQSIESWADITILVDHITEIDTHLESIFSAGSNTSIPVSNEFSIEKERLQKEWHQKTEAIGQLQMIHDAIGVLRNKLTGNPQLSELIFLNAEINSLSQQCINVVDISVINLRNRYLKEIEEELRTAITESFSRAEQRVIELSVVGETDVQLAVDILQNKRIADITLLRLDSNPCSETHS
uniref:Tektin n=1 Tax=Brugia timori TaxID=42155 RepID=A0A0R3QE83_9BILA